MSTFGLDYRPALVNREGIGRATRELVRGLGAELAEDEALGLFGWTLSPVRYGIEALGLHARARLHRRRIPARLTGPWLQLTGGAARAVGAGVFHHTQPRRLPVRGVPTTTMIWDLLFLDDNGAPGGPWVAPDTAKAMARSAREAAEASDLVLVPTAFVQDEVERKLGVPRDRLRIVGLGADHLPEPRLDELITRPPFVLTVGRIDPRKNHRQALAAFEHLVAVGLPHHWMVVGPRGWRSSEVLAAFDASPARERITVEHDASDQRIADLLAMASACLFPSMGEGFGLPPVEAQRAGVPVVALRTSCLPEVLGQGAAWAEPGPDVVEQLAVALEGALLDSARRRELTDLGRTNAARHTWRASAAAHLAAWRELI